MFCRDFNNRDHFRFGGHNWAPLRRVWVKLKGDEPHKLSDRSRTLFHSSNLERASQKKQQQTERLLSLERQIVRLMRICVQTIPTGPRHLSFTAP